MRLGLGDWSDIGDQALLPDFTFRAGVFFVRAFVGADWARAFARFGGVAVPVGSCVALRAVAGCGGASAIATDSARAARARSTEARNTAIRLAAGVGAAASSSTGTIWRPATLASMTA
jgi:hypothetical protein